MTAARSDLMALADRLRMWPAADGADGRSSTYIESLMQEAAGVLASLAASQPDREAIAKAIYEVSRKAIEPGLGMKLCEYEDLEPRDLRLHRDYADAALSLLSGAGTKSDGAAGGGYSQSSLHDNGDQRHAPSDAQGAAKALHTAATPSSAVEGVRWRHKKRGTTYTEVGRGLSQFVGFDDQPIVIYRSDADGRLWARAVSEFEDGRFERISSPVPEKDGKSSEGDNFQQRVQPWMLACFGPEISADKTERNHRFLEEALELVQSTGCTQSEAHQLVDYVYARPVGETHQEIGGVMVTLAALCLAIREDMDAAAETELARIWTKVEKIRAKQTAKPKHSPLPGPSDAIPSSAPVPETPHNSGERDPAVTPDSAGAEPEMGGNIDIIARTHRLVPMKNLSALYALLPPAPVVVDGKRFEYQDPMAAERLHEIRDVFEALMAAASASPAPVAPLATKKTYIKPLRTIVEIDERYADKIRDLLNATPPVADGVREALKPVDDADLAYLSTCLNDGGRGRFWQQIIATWRAALTPAATPSPVGAEEIAREIENGLGDLIKIGPVQKSYCHKIAVRILAILFGNERIRATPAPDTEGK